MRGVGGNGVFLPFRILICGGRLKIFYSFIVNENISSELRFEEPFIFFKSLNIGLFDLII